MWIRATLIDRDRQLGDLAGDLPPLSPRACCEQVATAVIERGQLIINELSWAVDQLASQVVTAGFPCFCNASCNGDR